MRKFKPTPWLTDALGALMVRGVGIGLIFVSTTVSARLLEPTEYGTYSAALSLAMLLATLAPLGMDRVLTQRIAIIGRNDDAALDISLTHAATTVVSMLILAIAVVLSLISGIAFHNRQWATVVMSGAALSVPFTATYLRQWIAIPLIGARRAIVPEQTLLPLLFTIAILTLAALGTKPNSMIATTIHFFATLVIFVATVRMSSLRGRYAAAWKTVPSIHWTDLIDRILMGLPFAAVSVGGILSRASMPLAVAAACGFKLSACFSLAMPYATLPGIPLGIFNMSLIPQCARHFQRGEFQEANQSVRSAATITFAIACCTSLIIWTCCPWLVLVLGEDYVAVCQILPILLLAAMVDCLTGPTIPVMQTMGMESFYTRALLAFLPFQLGLVYAVGRVYGLIGVAVAYLIARCLWNSIIVLQIYRDRGLLMLPLLRISKSIFSASAGFSPEDNLNTVETIERQ